MLLPPCDQVGALGLDECQGETGTKKRLLMLPYTPGQSSNRSIAGGMYPAASIAPGRVKQGMELARGIEPPTGGLQNRCSAD